MYASLRALYLIIWEEYLRKLALAPCKKVESDAFGTWTVRPKKGVPHHQKMLLNNATYLQQQEMGVLVVRVDFLMQILAKKRKKYYDPQRGTNITTWILFFNVFFFHRKNYISQTLKDKRGVTHMHLHGSIEQNGSIVYQIKQGKEDQRNDLLYQS